jgi:hypothetical protein
MSGMKVSLAVLGTVLALSIAASDTEARHCRHQRHQQRSCCSQGHDVRHGHPDHGYSNHNNQNCCQQLDSNACCGMDQMQQSGSYPNQTSSHQTNAGYVTTPLAPASVSYAAPVVVHPPQSFDSHVVVPATEK